MGLLVLIEPEIPTTWGIGRKRWVEYWNLPKSPDFFEAGLRSVSGQLLELLGATYSWTGKANSQFDQESLESSLAFPKFRLARFFFSTNFSFFSFFSRLERCSQCSAIRTQTLDQAGTGDQSSIDSSISNREKTESRRGQLSSNWLNPLWWPAPSLAHS